MGTESKREGQGVCRAMSLQTPQSVWLKPACTKVMLSGVYLPYSRHTADCCLLAALLSALVVPVPPLPLSYKTRGISLLNFSSPCGSNSELWQQRCG